MRNSHCLAIVLAAAAVLHGQPATPRAAFEVASVRPQDQRGQRPEVNGFYTYPGGRVVGHGCTLEYLIEQAFNMQGFQISAGPGWMNSDRFEVEGRPPSTAKSVSSNPSSIKAPPNDEQREMVQVLLEDRFHLKYHKESRPGTVYRLVKGSKPPRLDEPKQRSDFEWVGNPRGGGFSGEGIAGQSASMNTLAARLSSYLRAPVLNQTGIEGQFDFRFDYVLQGDERPDLISSILTSVQGLGLKLESATGPVETIVIDYAEKPAEN